MGLEDRDWYREKPSQAWNDRFKRRDSGGFRSSTGGGAPSWQEPVDERVPAATKGRSYTWVYAACSLIAGLWLLADHHTAALTALDSLLRKVSPPTSVPRDAVTPSTASSRIVRLGSRPELDVPARAVARWSLDDPRFGAMTVIVPVGTTPREAIRVALAERGYQTVP